MAKTAEELQDKLKRVTEAAVGMERRCAELRAQTEHAKERLSEAKEALREVSIMHGRLVCEAQRRGLAEIDAVPRVS
eukprot:2996123-Rhodomonas_salina.4